MRGDVEIFKVRCSKIQIGALPTKIPSSKTIPPLVRACVFVCVRIWGGWSVSVYNGEFSGGNGIASRQILSLIGIGVCFALRNNFPREMKRNKTFVSFLVFASGNTVLLTVLFFSSGGEFSLVWFWEECAKFSFRCYAYVLNFCSLVSSIVRDSNNKVEHANDAADCAGMRPREMTCVNAISLL